MSASALSALDVPPLSLYVHVPWCVRKCPYCDFNSHGVGKRADLPEGRYLEALIADLEADLPLVAGRELVSIFIGGGTPSLMSGGFYERLLQAVASRLPLAADIEITLEANPGTLERGRFAHYRAAGINRLSLGVQSFQDAQLAALGRIHGGDDAVAAVEEARQAGFDNLNIDLMHGLPQQTPALALADLDRALSLSPEHLSWYQLTLEPNTEFYSRPPVLPDDDRLWDIYEKGGDYLRRHGYTDYEVSAWSRPGMASRHNLNYWTFGDYLALGAGAHGKITSPGQQSRYWKTRQPSAYLNRIGSRTAGSETIETSELPLEFLMNALRLTEGVDDQLFSARTGLPLSTVAVKLEQLRKENLLTPDRIKATELGQRYLNSLLERFL